MQLYATFFSTSYLWVQKSIKVLWFLFLRAKWDNTFWSLPFFFIKHLVISEILNIRFKTLSLCPFLPLYHLLCGTTQGGCWFRNNPSVTPTVLSTATLKLNTSLIECDTNREYVQVTISQPLSNRINYRCTWRNVYNDSSNKESASVVLKSHSQYYLYLPILFL